MEIKSVFQINDYVQHKLTRQVVPNKNWGDKYVVFYEVIEIKSITCSAGTQVFYVVSPIHGAVAERKDKNEPYSIAEFLPAFMESGRKIEFREDEIVGLSEWVKKEISKEPIAQVSDTTKADSSPEPQQS